MFDKQFLAAIPYIREVGLIKSY